MVNAPTFCLLSLLAMAQVSGGASAGASDLDPGKAVGSALGKGTYPWYDPQKDAIRPIVLPADRTPSKAKSSTASPSNWSGSWLGDAIATIGFVVALGALIALIAWFWRMYEPIDTQDVPSSKNRGEPSRIEALPAGMRREFESSDPWEEALRRRDRGDLAGAVVCLFAHQLLTLSRLGLVRLAPGKTGRQILRAVVDAEFRRLAHPTLRQFEAVYYGHRDPSPEEFAAVWAEAEAFERRVAEGVVA